MDAFDFIVVGGGSAGCVVAAKLSENPAFSVLLLEAGPSDDSPFVHMPKGFVKVLENPKRMWVVPQGPRRGADARQEYWMGGKMLGGSNSVNGMQFNRGQPWYYDELEARGCRGWGWHTIGSTFKKMEDHQLGEGPYRGVGGPVHLQVNRPRLPLHRALIDAGVQAGLTYVPDLNNTDAEEGIGYGVWNIRNGRRFGTAQSFLKPAKRRRNLTILVNTVVTRLVFDGKRATAVECLEAGQMRQFTANREIIVSAGVVHSPKLLQLSGVGPTAVLSAAGVATLVDLPGVGRNMRDHRYLPVQVRADRACWNTNREHHGARLLKNIAQYYLAGTGPLTWAVAEIAAFIKTRPDLAHSDAHLVMQTFSRVVSAGGLTLELEKEPGFGLIAGITNSETEGQVTIRSSNWSDPPVIEFQPMAAERDRQIAPPLLRYVRMLCQQPALREHIIAETLPGPNVRSDDEIIAAFKELGSSGLHTVGTCKMGSDSLAVIDERLAVRGLANVRVADCSILPTCASGSGGTSAAAMMIGWRAAELLLADARR